MSTIIVTNPDVDGVLAASVLLAGVDTEWVANPVEFANYQDLDAVLRLVLSTSVDEVYLVDLDPKEIGRATFGELVVETRLHLVDHHSLSTGRRKQIEKSGGTCWRPQPGEHPCSTELAIRAIGQSTDGRLALVAAAGRADDYNDQTVSGNAQRLACDLGRALMPGSNVARAVVVTRLAAELRNSIAGASVTSFSVSQDLEAWLHTAAEDVERKQAVELETLHVESFHLESGKLGKVLTACARAPNVLFGKPGVDAIQHKRPEADIAAAFFEDGACWTFPRGFPYGRLDLLPLLDALGGGGRDGGGGFGFIGPTNEQNYPARRDSLLIMIRAYGKDPEFKAAIRAVPGGLRRPTK